MGHEAGQGHFNDQNQWSSSMIKCKLNSISFCRISLLSVCWLQVIKKVIRENERRLWGIPHFQSGACLIIWSIFYMNTHNTICDRCDKNLFNSMCCLPNATKSRWTTKNIVVWTLKLCTMALKFHSYTHSVQKKQLINLTGLHLGFERDGESSAAKVEESSLSVCLDEEPALAKCSGGQ